MVDLIPKYIRIQIIWFSIIDKKQTFRNLSRLQQGLHQNSQKLIESYFFGGETLYKRVLKVKYLVKSASRFILSL